MGIVETVSTVQMATLNPVVTQAIALVTHANAFLHGRVAEPTELLGEHSAFRTTFELTFDRLGPGERPYPLADGTAPWLRRIQKEEVPRMHLVLVPLPLERATRVAGLPEPRWGLVTEGDVGTELWAPNWTIRIGINAKEVAAPWKVSWQAEKSTRGVLKGNLEVAEAEEKLGSALKTMASFVRAMGSDREKLTFEELLLWMSDPKLDPQFRAHPDLFENRHYSRPAWRLGVLSSVAAGLFTAAGWKDRRIENEQVQEAFDFARAEVWETAIVGLQSAVNSAAS